MEANKVITEFFDSLAEDWDKTNQVKKETAYKILSYAGITAGKTVLDAGCGTGVMLPFYIETGAAYICAVDISPKMLQAAGEKFHGDNIKFVLCDIAAYTDERKYDCVMVHNAFPHFRDVTASLKSLEALVKPGGTLTVAHSISRERVIQCHKNVPHISRILPEADELARMLGNEFYKIQTVSDDELYLVTGTKRR